MILLDTNVLSELLRPEPNQIVFRWVAGQSRQALFTSCVTEAEILAGIARLAPGRRRDRLTEMAEGLFREDFAGRVLPVGRVEAARFGTLAAARHAAGRPLAAFDGLIAATAAAAGADVATRDTSGFSGCGLTLIDPWTGLVTS